MRLKITLAYAGGAYAGWQRQAEVPTVQAALEAAAAAICGRPAAITGAGRTDAGVHAAAQVAHLDVELDLEPAEWRDALNANLPDDIRVHDVAAADAEFHARYSATGKLYCYAVDDAPVASPFLSPFSWHVGARLDLESMRAAARHLEGPLDQRAFASRPEPGPSQRPLESVCIERDRLVVIAVTGRSFLRYAVRGMVGTLVQVGRGRRDPDSVAELARSGDRAAAGPTAPPHGLTLVRVDYAAPS